MVAPVAGLGRVKFAAINVLRKGKSGAAAAAVIPDEPRLLAEAAIKEIPVAEAAREAGSRAVVIRSLRVIAFFRRLNLRGMEPSPVGKRGEVVAEG